MLFSSDEFIPKMLHLAGTTRWIGTHKNLKLDRTTAKVILIKQKLLADKALQEEEEYEYIPVDPVEHVEPLPYSTPRIKRLKHQLLPHL